MYVSWYAAMAYAQWAGKRLPTEAEWEKAARGGLVGKAYSWGDDRPDVNKASYYWSPMPTPVGSYPPNGYGLYDMTGNVWQWCLDAYEEDFYARSPRRNPLAGAMTLSEVLRSFQTVTTSRVTRGGSSWDFWSDDSWRVAFRSGDLPTYAGDEKAGLLGFRCARDVTP